jgi:two-component system, NarL family, sensor kinase
MSRGGRLALIVAAWVGPLAWLAFWASTATSDGTVVSGPAAVLGEGRWGESLLVLETYGDTPLRPGDEILRIEDAEASALTTGAGHRSEGRGDVLRYQVRRPAGDLDVIQQVEVPLTRYAVGAALLENPQVAVVSLGLLVAGTFLILRRAAPTPAAATLLAGAAAGVALTAQPFGIQALEVAGAGSLWPHVVGELAVGLALGSLLVAVWAFPRAPGVLAAPRGWALLAVPFVASACWLAAYAARQPAPARLQAQLDLTISAVVTVTVLGALALATGRHRAGSVDERVAHRLLVSALLTAAVVLLVLDLVPIALRGSPLVAGEVLALVLVPVVVACWVAAVLGYRLVEIDATLRRSLLQLVLASLVGAVFLAAANAVNLAAGTSVRSMVTGGVVALVLLPAALLLRRTASRLVYGDRAFPYRVVSELRRLEPATGPEQVLDEMLSMLSRSLGLDYARIESTGSTSEGRFAVERGERRGEPTTVELEVAGTSVGRLEMEVSPLREPFGPRDRRLLEDVGTQVGALVQALVAGRELQRSRERLVAAREEERRRLRRDLHDGLGPSLATTLMRLEVARELMDRDPVAARDLVARLVDQTEADIGEVRRLVDGLRPPALDQLGLVSALRQRADLDNQAVALGSTAPRWTVTADELGVLPAAVEVAAYRIAVEAVNNAVRHSGGTQVAVTLRRRPDALELVIRDDGSGITDVRGVGVGIGSMRDRAEELGGTCTVSAPPGGGTEVVAHLPLTERAHGVPEEVL